MVRSRLVKIQVSPELGEIKLGRTKTGSLMVSTESNPYLVLVTLPPPDKGEIDIKQDKGTAEIWWDREPG